MNVDPLISVLMLSFNSPDIYSSVNSLLMQDYPQIQFILVDDASTEYDVEELEKYINSNKDSNLIDFRIIKNKHNIGIVKSSNIGIREIKGEIVFNLAGDDQFNDSRVISEWVNEFKNTNAEVMTAYREVYDSDLNEMLYKAPFDNEVSKILNNKPEDLFEIVSGRNFIFGAVTARKKEVFDKYGLYDEKYRLIDDHPMVLRLLRQGVKIWFFDRVVIKYRLGGISYGNKFNAEYAKEADLVFKREVLPFTKNRKLAKKIYSDWKNDVKNVSGFDPLKEKYKNKKLRLFMVYVFRNLKNPIPSIKRILKDPEHIRKKLSGDK